MNTQQWHKEQIEKYRVVQPDYVRYAKILQDMLIKACRLYAPLAIVQARPKSLSSFAEKAARKAFKYSDPVNQLTDLCGARVITQTFAEANRICEFIKTNFTIDEANSLDLRSRLTTAEFGYLSVHYIVTPKGEDILGLSVPEQIRSKKAEIQVRTILQHAWADICHDRIYKSTIRVPERWMRESARLAAIMENADSAFGNMVKNLDAYKSNYAAHLTERGLEQEIELLNIIFQNEPDPSAKPDIALKLAKLYQIQSQWEKVVETLIRFEGSHVTSNTYIQIELGWALCQLNLEQPNSEEYQRGQALIEKVARVDLFEKTSDSISKATPDKEGENYTRAFAMSLLAESYRNVKGADPMMRTLYEHAFHLDPQNPYYLASFLEHEICYRHDLSFVAILASVIKQALIKCRDHIRVNIEGIRAYLTIGRLSFLLNDPYTGLNVYAKAMELYLSDETAAVKSLLDGELTALERIYSEAETPSHFKWIISLITIGKAVRENCPEALEPFTSREKTPIQIKSPVVIIVGTIEQTLTMDREGYRILFEQGFRGFKGLVITSGASTELTDLVSSVTTLLRNREISNLTHIEYSPRMSTTEVRKDAVKFGNTTKNSDLDFSPLEAFQYWADILRAGIAPEGVKVIALGGGHSTGFALRLALALGASVGILVSSGGAVNEIIADEDWAAHFRLLQLPTDAMTLWNFISEDTMSELSTEQIELAAIKVHAHYLEKKSGGAADLNLVPWEYLSDEFKESNRKQAIGMKQALEFVGCTVKVADSIPQQAPELSDSMIEKLAEIEHGRWNLERLRAGWKYESSKDIARKRSPFLVPWRELPEDIKELDREVVRQFARILTEAGFEVILPQE